MASKFKRLFRSPSIRRIQRNETEFIQAIMNENISQIRKLMKDKVRIHSPLPWDKHGNELIYPIHLGCALGSVEIVKFLLKMGSSLDIKTESGWTPLHFAVTYNLTQPDVTRHLLDMGAKFNVKDKARGYTAFHCACESGNFGAVKCLLEVTSGHVPDSTGKTPRDIAKYNGHNEMTALFERYDYEVRQKQEMAELPKRMREVERKTEILFQRQRHCSNGLSTAVDSGFVEFEGNHSRFSNHLDVPRVSGSYVIPGRTSWPERPYLATSYQCLIQQTTGNQPSLSKQYSKSTDNCCKVITKDSAITDIHRNQILRKYSFLCSNMKPQRLIIKFFSKGYIQMACKETLDTIPTNHSKNDFLLSNLILRGSMKLYEDFIQSLKDTDQPHIAEELRIFIHQQT